MPNYGNNNNVCAAWRNFIENRREETGRAVAGDPQFSRMFEEFQGTIDALVDALQGGAAVSLGELADRLERLRDLNDALLAAVEEQFYLAGLEDGISLAQWIIISGAGNGPAVGIAPKCGTGEMLRVS